MSDLTGEQKKILEALAGSDSPCGSKDIVAATGLDKKLVSNKIAALKKAGLVDSPVRCKYGVTEAGIKVIS
jgi:predicted transcriptional regulator